jgi:hypothetical protein
MNRRRFLQAGVAMTLAAKHLIAAPSPVPPMAISSRFKRLEAPETRRLAVQLTSGDSQCYPLYYYVPSITADNRYLVYHKSAGGQLQLHRLDLTTAESVQLTYATCEDTQWRPWCVDSGRGVLDHRSSLNVPRNLAVYFDGRRARAVDVATLRDEPLFDIPADRDAYGRTACSPDGQWLVYIHVPHGAIWGEPCEGAVVAAYHFDTRRHHTLCRIDSAVFHVTDYDNQHFVVTHPADEPGMMLADFTSGTARMLRKGVIHCPTTARGIAFESPDDRRLGLFDPLATSWFEFPMPAHFRYLHTGCDPAGRLFFYENSTSWDEFDEHDMHALVRLGSCSPGATRRPRPAIYSCTWRRISPTTTALESSGSGPSGGLMTAEPDVQRWAAVPYSTQRLRIRPTRSASQSRGQDQEETPAAANVTERRFACRTLRALNMWKI